MEYDVDTNFMSFQKKNYVCAGNGSFDIKDKLKTDGFSFDKNKKIWKKEGTQADLTAYEKKYPDVEWIYM